MDLDKVVSGEIKTHFEVVAIDNSENYFMFVESFDDINSAYEFCYKCDFKYDAYMTWGINHCRLKILKVTTEVCDESFLFSF